MVKHNTRASLSGRFAIFVTHCLLVIYTSTLTHGETLQQYPYEPVFASFTLSADAVSATTTSFRCVVSRPNDDTITNDISRLRMWAFRDHATNRLIKCLAYVDRNFDQPSIFANPGKYTITIHGYTNIIDILPHVLPSDSITLPLRMLLFRISTLVDAGDCSPQLRDYSLQLLNLTDHDRYTFYARTYLATEAYYTNLTTLKTTLEGRAMPNINAIVAAFPAMERPNTLIGATYLYHMSQSLIYTDPMAAVDLKRYLLSHYFVSPYHDRIVAELGLVNVHESRD